MAAIPLVVIPVFLFGGLIKPYQEMVLSPLAAWLSLGSPIRWAFQSLSRAAEMPDFFAQAPPHGPLVGPLRYDHRPASYHRMAFASASTPALNHE